MKVVSFLFCIVLYMIALDGVLVVLPMIDNFFFRLISEFVRFVINMRFKL